MMDMRCIQCLGVGCLAELLSYVCVPRTVQDQLPAGIDERRKWVWFKALKWVLHITYRLFNR